MFINPEVPLESLPSADNLDWHALHPSFVRRLQLGALIRVLVIGAIGTVAYLLMQGGDSEAMGRFADWLLSYALIAFGVFAASILIWPVIAVPRRGYVVREKDILYKTGVLWRSVKAVPFNRVQHTKIDSGLLDRRFGLANLSVFPAGAGGHKIRGLGTDTAERLRVYVSERIEAEAIEPADDERSPPPDPRTEAGAAPDNGPVTDAG
ncbi:MAG: PH domain-containing protein [Gemmatimonadota bacterium]|nr:PH domain-containing protein [Gemmatimonadota bacterium]